MMFKLFLVLLAPLLCSTTSILTDRSVSTNTSSCNCEDVEEVSGTGRNEELSKSICNNFNLGPVDLPQKLPLLSLVSNYKRFNGYTPAQFLEQWQNYSNTDEYAYLYPPEDGFLLDNDGNPIKGEVVLQPGEMLDRFGSEGGEFLGAADAPFDQRSLPPSNLNTVDGEVPYNYYVYEVLKNLTVEAGPIAPWFGQPGLGTQFYVGGTGRIYQLVQDKYLKNVSLHDIIPGPGKCECGQ